MTNTTSSPADAKLGAENNTQILHRDDLPLGGFAGLREHRLVMDSRAWGRHKNSDAWDGVGDFVYLADARFIPHGETGLHPHHEIDVISVMVEGRIAHGGSLSDGQDLSPTDVQIQRAGGEGFTHNEVNPDDAPNRMLQLWVLPEQPGEPAGYKVYHPSRGTVTRVYGGEPGQDDTFASRTLIDVALLHSEQTATFDGPLLAYVSQGCGLANGQAVADGDLIRADRLEFIATDEVQLTVVQALI